MEGGCDSCEIGLRRKEEDQTISCLPPDTDSCEPGYHMTAVSTTSASPMAGRKVTTRRPSAVTGWPRAHVLTIMLTTATVTISYRED